MFPSNLSVDTRTDDKRKQFPPLVSAKVFYIF